MREYAEKEKILYEKLRNERNQLIEEQLRDIQEMQQEFANASDLMD